MSALRLEAANLLDHDLFADHEPWELFDLLLREAPVYRHPEPDGGGFWVVTRYDDVLAVVRDPKTFSSEVGGAATIENLPDDVLEARRNFLEFDPPKHGRYRRLISTSFTPGAVARYEEWLRGLIAGEVGGGPAAKSLPSIGTSAKLAVVRVVSPRRIEIACGTSLSMPEASP